MKKLTAFSRLSFKIHAWLGLTTGLFYLIMGLSGSLLLFRDELDVYLNKETHFIQQGHQYVPLDSMVYKIASKNNDLSEIDLLHFPKNAHDSYEFLLFKNVQSNNTSNLYSVFINPYNNQIIKEGSYSCCSYSFFRWLYQLHYCFQTGTLGMLLTAIIGLLMIGSIITGLIIYRKHLADAFRIKTFRRLKRRNSALSALHRIIGVWTLLFNLLIFFTGFWLNLPAFNKDNWAITSHGKYFLPKSSVDKMLEKVRQDKEFMPFAISIPLDSKATVQIQGRFSNTNFLVHDYASHYSFDKQSGTIKEVYNINHQSIYTRFNTMAYQVHTGKIGGLFIKIFYILIGLAPGVLSITGFLLWWRKRKTQIKNF